MNQRLVEKYWDEYGKSYLSKDIIKTYPETKIIPRYLLEKFPKAKIVLDLGFGTGVWFWASFLPNLTRLDGIDLHPEALAAADKIFEQKSIPEGYALIHRKLGRKFTREDLENLSRKRGVFFFFDYTKTWPRKIKRNYYDLVTEHGGGFGEMKTEKELETSVRKCAKVLKRGGHLLFVNFQLKSKSFCLNEEMISRAVQGADMTLVEFHKTRLLGKDRATSSIQKILYGYARKVS